MMAFARAVVIGLWAIVGLPICVAVGATMFFVTFAGIARAVWKGSKA